LSPKNIITVVSFCIVASILWNTYDFSKRLKTNERTKMEILAIAYDRFGSGDLNQEVSLEAKIITSNHDIPMIVTDGEGHIEMSRNLDSIKASDTLYMAKKLNQMKKENKPLVVNYLKGKQYVIYYEDSKLLTKLRYYPLTLILILVLFSTIIYLVFKSNKIAEQNKLWTGMAKETAHQIGTPISSLIGWVELMKMDEIGPAIVPEIEKDIARLNVIADRFSKIGSVPIKVPSDIVGITQNSIDYFEARSFKSIQFTFEKPEKEMIVNVNEQLFAWVLENLIKNAIDGMSGKGMLKVGLESNDRFVSITVEDSGKGIPKKLYKKIFTPGFTTKKRGWGLGLSLSKRIIEEYHSGKIFVKKSEINKGSTFEIQLDLLKPKV